MSAPEFDEEFWFDATIYDVLDWHANFGSREEARAAWDHWLNDVRAEAVRKHEEKRVVLHFDPPQPVVHYVPVPCPHCGWSR